MNDTLVWNIFKTSIGNLFETFLIHYAMPTLVGVVAGLGTIVVLYRYEGQKKIEEEVAQSVREIENTEEVEVENNTEEAESEYPGVNLPDWFDFDDPNYGIDIRSTDNTGFIYSTDGSRYVTMDQLGGTEVKNKRLEIRERSDQVAEIISKFTLDDLIRHCDRYEGFLNKLDDSLVRIIAKSIVRPYVNVDDTPPSKTPEVLKYPHNLLRNLNNRNNHTSISKTINDGLGPGMYDSEGVNFKIYETKTKI